MKLLNKLRRDAGVRSLLSAIDTNPKVAKSGKLGVMTGILHLAPGDMSGHEVCPKRSPGCSAACLHYAGSPVYMQAKTQARITKTKLFFSDFQLFMNILALEIDELIAKAKKANMEPALRLNGTSDIVWERKRFRPTAEVAEALATTMDLTSVISLFPTTTFYDYTAIPSRNVPENYHLTFSLKEHNVNDALAALAQGINVAAVFPGKLPESYLDVTVINGDEHDYRPADPAGVIVGLKAKGQRGRSDTTGFVQHESAALLVAA